MLVPRAFWFLRHGETDWNARGLSQGNVDIPLNEVGMAQARTAAGMLRTRGLHSIVASPLSRAHDTALVVAAMTGLAVALQDDLREVSFGAQEGQPMADWFDDWLAGRMTPEGAESFAGLRARAVQAANRALAHPAPVLVVAHGALFRALRAEMGLPVDVRLANGVPLFCEPGPPGAPWTLTPASAPASGAPAFDAPAFDAPTFDAPV
jgi:broad specificity phosphatase PhoE